MSSTYNEKLRLLSEAPQLISRAVKAGWISYPENQRFNADGSPDPMLLEDSEPQATRHTPEAMIRAYELRCLGMALDSVATACKVPRGSIVYMIAKGHELTLANEREAAAKAAAKPEEL
jgi:hypothetical protein